MVGIDKTLEVFEDLTNLAVSGIKLYKYGIGLQSFTQLWGVIDSVKELVFDLPSAMPELVDLDSEECGKLGAAAHRMLKEIAEAFAE